MKNFSMLLLFATLFFSACDYEKGVILFNSQPITKENILQNDKIFSVGQKVYYIFLAPKRIESEFVRVQVFKMTDKAPWGGNEVVRTIDSRLMKQEKFYYTDYFTFYESGRYVMQVFTRDNMQSPVAICDFFVK